MRARIKPRLSYANVVSTIAAFAALATGGAYAADKITAKDIKNNAVRAKHIKKNQVKAKHVARNAVRTPKIADGAISSAKLGTITPVENRVAVAGGEGGSVSVECPNGQTAISGGADWPGTNMLTNDDVAITHVRPTISEGTPVGWNALGRNDKEAARDLRVHALCLRP